jgi:hypothetical protein
MAYLYLPDHPGEGVSQAAVRQVRLNELLPHYEGATLYLDFDEHSRLIGIEILI